LELKLWTTKNKNSELSTRFRLLEVENEAIKNEMRIVNENLKDVKVKIDQPTNNPKHQKKRKRKS
jgi:hypothetical protein